MCLRHSENTTDLSFVLWVPLSTITFEFFFGIKSILGRLDDIRFCSYLVHCFSKGQERQKAHSIQSEAH